MIKLQGIEYYLMLDFTGGGGWNKLRSKYYTDKYFDYTITTNTDPSYANDRLNNVSDIYLKLWRNLNKFSINFKARFNTTGNNTVCYIIDVLTQKGTWPVANNVVSYPGSYRAKYPEMFSAYDNLRNDAYTYPCSKYNMYNFVHTYNLVCDNNQWSLYSDGKQLGLTFGITFNDTRNKTIFIGIANYFYSTYSENADKNNHELYWLTVTNTPQSKLPAIPYSLDKKDDNMYGIQKQSG